MKSRNLIPMIVSGLLVTAGNAAGAAEPNSDSTIYCKPTRPFLRRNGPDPYFVSLDLPTARHPQTLLATHLNGKPLTLAHGTPLRLVVPVKLDLKNINAITQITYTEDEPADIGRGADIRAMTEPEYLSCGDLRNGSRARGAAKSRRCQD